MTKNKKARKEFMSVIKELREIHKKSDISDHEKIEKTHEYLDEIIEK